MTIDPLKWVGKWACKIACTFGTSKNTTLCLALILYLPRQTSGNSDRSSSVCERALLALRQSGTPPRFYYWWSPSEEHLRREKIQTGADSSGSLRTFRPSKESGHRGERRSRGQTFHADTWETSQGRLTPFTAGAFFLVSGVSIARVAANETHQPCAEPATRSIWEHFPLQLFKHQSRRDPFESVFMTHFGKFAGGYFKRPCKTCSAACKTTPLSLISNRNVEEFQDSRSRVRRMERAKKIHRIKSLPQNNASRKTEAKAEESEFIVEKEKKTIRTTLAREQSILAHRSFIWQKKKKKLQILIIYTNTPAFKNKSLI